MRLRWYAAATVAALFVAGALVYSTHDDRVGPIRPVAGGEALDPAVAAKAGPAVPDPALAAPLVRGEVRYTKAGARFLPPTDGDRPAVSAADALDVFRRSGLRVDVLTDGGTPTIDLARFSNEHLGPLDPVTGVVTPTIQDRLSWVITFPTAGVAVRGGRGHGPIDGGRCPFVYVVDAVSGAPIDAFQECAPQVG